MTEQLKQGRYQYRCVLHYKTASADEGQQFIADLQQPLTGRLLLLMKYWVCFGLILQWQKQRC